MSEYIYRNKKGKRVLLHRNKNTAIVYDAENMPERFNKEYIPPSPSAINRAWKALFNEVLYELNDHKYSDGFAKMSESDVRFSKKIAYEPIIYKSFKQRCEEATEVLRTLLEKQI